MHQSSQRGGSSTPARAPLHQEYPHVGAGVALASGLAAGAAAAAAACCESAAPLEGLSCMKTSVTVMMPTIATTPYMKSCRDGVRGAMLAFVGG